MDFRSPERGATSSRPVRATPLRPASASRGNLSIDFWAPANAAAAAAAESLGDGMKQALQRELARARIGTPMLKAKLRDRPLLLGQMLRKRSTVVAAIDHTLATSPTATHSGDPAPGGDACADVESDGRVALSMGPHPTASLSLEGLIAPRSSKGGDSLGWPTHDSLPLDIALKSSLQISSLCSLEWALPACSPAEYFSLNSATGSSSMGNTRDSLCAELIDATRLWCFPAQWWPQPMLSITLGETEKLHAQLVAEWRSNVAAGTATAESSSQSGTLRNSNSSTHTSKHRVNNISSISNNSSGASPAAIFAQLQLQVQRATREGAHSSLRHTSDKSSAPTATGSRDTAGLRSTLALPQKRTSDGAAAVTVKTSSSSSSSGSGSKHSGKSGSSGSGSSSKSGSSSSSSSSSRKSKSARSKSSSSLPRPGGVRPDHGSASASSMAARILQKVAAVRSKESAADSGSSGNGISGGSSSNCGSGSSGIRISGSNSKNIVRSSESSDFDPTRGSPFSDSIAIIARIHRDGYAESTGDAAAVSRAALKPSPGIGATYGLVGATQHNGPASHTLASASAIPPPVPPPQQKSARSDWFKDSVRAAAARQQELVASSSSSSSSSSNTRSAAVFEFEDGCSGQHPTPLSPPRAAADAAVLHSAAAVGEAAAIAAPPGTLSLSCSGAGVPTGTVAFDRDLSTRAAAPTLQLPRLPAWWPGNKQPLQQPQPQPSSSIVSASARPAHHASSSSAAVAAARIAASLSSPQAVQRLKSSEQSGVAAWTDRVTRFQCAVTSAWGRLAPQAPLLQTQQGHQQQQRRSAAPGGVGSLPYFVIRFPPDADLGNVLLVAKRDWLAASRSSNSCSSNSSSSNGDGGCTDSAVSGGHCWWDVPLERSAAELSSSSSASASSTTTAKVYAQSKSNSSSRRKEMSAAITAAASGAPLHSTSFPPIDTSSRSTKSSLGDSCVVCVLARSSLYLRSLLRRARVPFTTPLDGGLAACDAAMSASQTAAVAGDRGIDAVLADEYLDGVAAVASEDGSDSGSGTRKKARLSSSHPDADSEVCAESSSAAAPSAAANTSAAAAAAPERGGSSRTRGTEHDAGSALLFATEHAVAAFLQCILNSVSPIAPLPAPASASAASSLPSSPPLLAPRFPLSAIALPGAGGDALLRSVFSEGRANTLLDVPQVLAPAPFMHASEERLTVKLQIARRAAAPADATAAAAISHRGSGTSGGYDDADDECAPAIGSLGAAVAAPRLPDLLTVEGPILPGQLRAICEVVTRACSSSSSGSDTNDSDEGSGSGGCAALMGEGPFQRSSPPQSSLHLFDALAASHLSSVALCRESLVSALEVSALEDHRGKSGSSGGGGDVECVESDRAAAAIADTSRFSCARVPSSRPGDRGSARFSVEPR